MTQDQSQSETTSKPSKTAKKATASAKRHSKKASTIRKQSQGRKTKKNPAEKTDTKRIETKTLRTFYITESNRELLVEYKQKEARNFDWQVNTAIKQWFANGCPY